MSLGSPNYPSSRKIRDETAVGRPEIEMTISSFKKEYIYC